MGQLTHGGDDGVTVNLIRFVSRVVHHHRQSVLLDLHHTGVG